VRTVLALADVRPLARSAFGAEPVDLTRLAGGSVKGVYRLAFAGGDTAMVYRWHRDENFWPARTVIDVGPFAADSSQATFLRKHELLTGLGVRVPRIFSVDPQLALVEDVRGGTLETLLARDATAARTSLDRLREMLLVMHSATTSDNSAEERCATVIVERGRRALAEAAARVPRIAARQDRLAYELSTRFAAVPPRYRHGVIHGELGPTTRWSHRTERRS
jgi:hypothetical protein